VNPLDPREAAESPQRDPSRRLVQRLRPVEVRPVSEVVAERLEALILDGTFRSGDQLPTEPQLAQALHVGRSTVREAKRALISRGLLESRQKLGTFVVGPPADPSKLASLNNLLTNPQLPELHESRQIVEVGSIRLAALRSTRQDLDDLYSALAEIGEEIENGQEDAWWRLIGFHRNLVAAAHNNVLLSIFDLTAHLISNYQVPFYLTVAELKLELESHRKLVDFLERRDAEGAAGAMYEHLEASEDLRRDAVEHSEELESRRGKDRRAGPG
jgi:GntR family transcriptional regulator, transcriptional repressor for pyruvate dehydrogenase complex